MKHVQYTFAAHGELHAAVKDSMNQLLNAINGATCLFTGQTSAVEPAGADSVICFYIGKRGNVTKCHQIRLLQTDLEDGVAFYRDGKSVIVIDTSLAKALTRYLEAQAALDSYTVAKDLADVLATDINS